MVSSTSPSDDHRESILDEEITETLTSDSVDEHLVDTNEIERPGSGINWNVEMDVHTLADFDEPYEIPEVGVGGTFNRHMWPEEISTPNPIPIGSYPDVENDLGLHNNDLGPNNRDLGVPIPEYMLDDFFYDLRNSRAILGQLADHLIFSGQSGNQPASQFAMDSLVEVVKLNQKESCEDMPCAVCTEKLSFSLVEQQLRKLPCSHFFHEDCILPWLRIRNTCPVCRYELPTDM